MGAICCLIPYSSSSVGDLHSHDAHAHWTCLSSPASHVMSDLSKDSTLLLNRIIDQRNIGVNSVLILKHGGLHCYCYCCIKISNTFKNPFRTEKKRSLSRTYSCNHCQHLVVFPEEQNPTDIFRVKVVAASDHGENGDDRVVSFFFPLLLFRFPSALLRLYYHKTNT